MSSYVLGLQEIDKTKRTLVGGKGANLGELSRAAGIHVPDGFCITTEAFRQIIGATSSIRELLDRLALLTVEDRDQIGELSREIRQTIEGIVIPGDIRDAITRYLSQLGEDSAYAVRSSATAEDLPTASFAGQQDTYLNIVGEKAILAHVSKCWASLFTERAVTYRLQNGFDHRKVLLSVVVQKMVFPQAAGILFTADPVTSNRKVLSIDASFGLGEALVSGRVNADSYKVRQGKIVERKIGTKKVAVHALKVGGTQEEEIAPEQQNRQALTDEQILQLEQMGRKIEEHFGSPQDIEWCLADDTFYALQSRPITTLYPIPDADDGVTNARSDQGNQVYLSVGHQQMMTDAMKPLGISMWQLTAARPMFQAGGRLFVDVTQQLASPGSRAALLGVMGQHDPLMKDALTTIMARGDFVETLPDAPNKPGPTPGNKGASSVDSPAQIETDPTIVADLIQRSEASVAALQQNIQALSGAALFDYILEDIQQLKQSLSDPQIMGVILTAMNAARWLNEKMKEWLGETSVADTLSQSVPNSITSEMGLALLNVADVIRPYPEVIEYLPQAKDANFLDELVALEGGQEVHDAICAFLDRYGMRCVGEIDITKPRWREKPTALVPMLLSNIKNLEPNASQRIFEQGRQEALEKEQALLRRLRHLPEGEEKAKETERMIRRLRNFTGYREYPKYGIVSRYFVYKQALLEEAERLVQANIMHVKEDIYYLTFHELREVVRTQQLDEQLVSKRKDDYAAYEKLTPPRVLTSDGEVIAGEYKRENLPAQALVGLAVSSGVIEGRARVLLNMGDGHLEEGDILVTPFTDPSWTPLFVSIKGLVTEVGGLMTHGAVIAREYGLPAVVSVENATKLIEDGQRIRVHGTEGYVEIL